ncbi:MAG TPA: hypothetical protein VFW65_32095 [Pseudonocardiaceae bacterium]|nr:hypothetical protein [Pseudonocardiaceae bacterium]
MYADVEALLVAYLTAAIPGVQGVAVDLPQDVLARLPFVQVNRVGGGDDYVTDTATVDVDTFHATRANASDVARTVHAAMMRLRHTAVAGVLVDSVETVTGPLWITYDDENLERYVATYLVETRVNAAP